MTLKPVNVPSMRLMPPPKAISGVINAGDARAGRSNRPPQSPRTGWFSPAARLSSLFVSNVPPAPKLSSDSEVNTTSCPAGPSAINCAPKRLSMRPPLSLTTVPGSIASRACGPSADHTKGRRIERPRRRCNRRPQTGTPGRLVARPLRPTSRIGTDAADRTAIDARATKLPEAARQIIQDDASLHRRARDLDEAVGSDDAPSRPWASTKTGGSCRHPFCQRTTCLRGQRHLLRWRRVPLQNLLQRCPAVQEDRVRSIDLRHELIHAAARALVR